MVNVRDLSEFSIHTQYRRSGLSCPTEDQVKDLCRQYKIDGDKIMTLVGEMTDDIHTIIIDADKFNKHIPEKRCRWCNKLIYFEDNPKYPDDFWAHVETNLMTCEGVYGYAEPEDSRMKHNMKIISQLGHGWLSFRCDKCGYYITLSGWSLWNGVYGSNLWARRFCKGGS